MSNGPGVGLGPGRGFGLALGAGRGRLGALPGTVEADAARLDVGGLDAADLAQRGRQGQRVEILAVEIARRAALHAHEMMVGVEVGVEPRPLAPGAERLDDAEIDQQPKGAIDGVERHGGHALAHPPINGLGIRMVAGRRHLAEDLQALGRQLGPGLPADPLEARHAGDDVGGVMPNDGGGLLARNELRVRKMD